MQHFAQCCLLTPLHAQPAVSPVTYPLKPQQQPGGCNQSGLAAHLLWKWHLPTAKKQWHSVRSIANCRCHTLDMQQSRRRPTLQTHAHWGSWITPPITTDCIYKPTTPPHHRRCTTPPLLSLHVPAHNGLPDPETPIQLRQPQPGCIVRPRVSTSLPRKLARERQPGCSS